MITDAVVTHLRPKTLEKDAMVGWKTVEVSRYDVAAQNASSALPLSFSAITYESVSIASSDEMPGKRLLAVPLREL